MCYYIASKLSNEQLVQLEHDFVLNWEENERDDFYMISGFTHPRLPVLTAEGRFAGYNWGLIPSWTKDWTDAKKRRVQCLNAVSETIDTLPSFRNAVSQGQFCIIPVNGFYEWHHSVKEKFPHYIYPKNKQVFYVAGLYEHWHDTTLNETHRTFSICTTGANDRMAWIHNSKQRMPAIMSLQDAKLWLDNNIAFEQKKQLLGPYSSEHMLDHPVSRLIISRRENTNVEAALYPYSYAALNQTELNF